MDTHAHLEAFGQVEGALEKARSVGVGGVVAVGMDLDSNQKTLTLAGHRRGITVYPALGLHPWRLLHADIEATLDFIKEHIKEIVAVGEIGLDFRLKEARKDPDTRKIQRDVFFRLLDLSKRHDKPALVHARGAWKDALSAAKEAGVHRAVFHWYSGPLDVLEEILDAGYFVSATPALRYSEAHRRAMAASPLEQILVETDSPVKYQGVEAQPAHVVETLSALSDLKKTEVGKAAGITSRNAARFFDL